MFRHVQYDYGVILKAIIIQLIRTLALAGFGILQVYSSLGWLGMRRYERVDWSLRSLSLGIVLCREVPRKKILFQNRALYVQTIQAEIQASFVV